MLDKLIITCAMSNCDKSFNALEARGMKCGLCFVNSICSDCRQNLEGLPRFMFQQYKESRGLDEKLCNSCIVSKLLETEITMDAVLTILSFPKGLTDPAKSQRDDVQNVAKQDPSTPHSALALPAIQKGSCGSLANEGSLPKPAPLVCPIPMRRFPEPSIEIDYNGPATARVGEEPFRSLTGHKRKYLARQVEIGVERRAAKQHASEERVQVGGAREEVKDETMMEAMREATIAVAAGASIPETEAEPQALTTGRASSAGGSSMAEEPNPFEKTKVHQAFFRRVPTAGCLATMGMAAVIAVGVVVGVCLRRKR